MNMNLMLEKKVVVVEMQNKFVKEKCRSFQFGLSKCFFGFR